MNLIALIDLLGAVFFGAALVVASRFDEEVVDKPSKIFLCIFLGIYFLVETANIIEHAGITGYFDRFEDYLEILFLPFFLFFLFSMDSRHELQRRLATEENLRKSREHYRSLVENIDFGVSLIDNNHIIVAVNAAQARMLNAPEESFIGRKCFRAFRQHNEICPDCPGVKSMQSKKPQEIETGGNFEGEAGQVLRYKAFPLFNGEDESMGFIEVVEDITERKKIEEELRNVHKLESIGILAGGIAHDFNNLLTGIMGNISLAKLYSPPDTKAYEKLTAAENASCQARDLTQQLLAFARGGAPIKQTTSIVELIRESVAFSLHGSNIKCDFQLAEDIKLLEVDQGQLSQVLQNLTLNACQAMPEGGKLRVSAHNVLLRAGQKPGLPSGEYVHIRCQDNGPGIREENIGKIFDPYFTTKEKGTGLGLAVCYAIIKNHDGIITVDSTPGAGSTFDIYLPASSSHDGEAEIRDSSIRYGTGRILLMDDDEIVQDAAAGILGQLGYEVETAPHGLEAVRIYREQMQSGRPFDLLILDLTVPGGMGGIETLREIQAIDPAVKAIVSSGYANDPVMAEYRSNGFQGVVPKPYKIEEISRVVHEVLNPG